MFWQLSAEWSWQLQYASRTLAFLWIFLLCRLIKYLDHFSRYPEDLKYLLVIPLFGYFHSSIIKLSGMFTLHVVSGIPNDPPSDGSAQSRPLIRTPLLTWLEIRPPGAAEKAQTRTTTTE